MVLTVPEMATKLSDMLEAMPVKKFVPSRWTDRLREYFGREPSDLPVMEVEYPQYQHPCIQLAIEHYLSVMSCKFELIGVGLSKYRDTLAELLDTVSIHDAQTEGPVKYLSVPLGEDRVLSCVERGLWLIDLVGERLAVCLFRREKHVAIEVMAHERQSAEAFLAELRRFMDQLSVYKGKVLSLVEGEEFGVRFQQLDQVKPESLVLPDGLIERIERHTVHFIRHKEAIAAAGFPIKRGILLHGVPGTGKSLTIRHLIARLGERTTILVYGCGLRFIGEVCNLARMLQPATVVIEDVDLVADDRRYKDSNPALVDLLNEMDGLASDADILFVLTTNRAEVLEPALKSRPGRIDQVIEVPLPDSNCRQRLFDLYTARVQTDIVDLERFIHQTKGASPAFIRELVRRAALLAILDGRTLQDRHLDDVVKEMCADGTLAKTLVGFGRRN